MSVKKKAVMVVDPEPPVTDGDEDVKTLPCPHDGLRGVLFGEEPDLRERGRRPFTCDDCNAIRGPLGSRFSMDEVIVMLKQEMRVLREKLDGLVQRQRERTHGR